MKARKAVPEHVSPLSVESDKEVRITGKKPCFYATAWSPKSVRTLSRTKKTVKNDSQKLEARLAARSIGDELEFLVREMEEEIDELEQEMEELLRSDSQSLRAGHPSACNEEREHHQTSRRKRDFKTRARRSKEAYTWCRSMHDREEAMVKVQWKTG